MNDRLIVALDVENKQRAVELVDALFSSVRLFKVGSILFTQCGPDIVTYIITKKNARVFLDLKFHDIPNTVAQAARAATALGVFMMTVHIQGGEEMLKAAMRAAQEKSAELKIERPKIVGITVLTSEVCDNVEKKVLERAKIAQDAGLDGAVCSAQEAAAVRNACGKDFIIVTPGIRPKSTQADDQKRVATAREAFEAGANYIVVGRPIIAAENPLEAATALLQE